MIGLTRDRVNELRDQAVQAGTGPGVDDVLAVASRVLGREAEALAALDLLALAAGVEQPARFLLGTVSPPWAAEVTTFLAAQLPGSEVIALEGEGHESLGGAPQRVVDELVPFFGAGMSTGGTSLSALTAGPFRAGREGYFRGR